MPSAPGGEAAAASAPQGAAAPAPDPQPLTPERERAAGALHAPHWRGVRRAAWPPAYFSPREMASRGDGSIRLVIAAGQRLDALRRLLGRPLVVHSAYRDPLHNARVGGAPLSRHKVGDAFDLRADGSIPRRELLGAAREAGFRGIGLYRSFIHLDCRPRPACWANGGPHTLALWT